MISLATAALEAAMRPGVTYADVRVVESTDRGLTTKNGRAATVSGAESIGVGIRVLADGCWGFAATDDLTPGGLQSTAALAISIARASAMAKKYDVVLAPEYKYESTWTSPCEIDPFSISVDEQLGYLLAVDTEMRSNSGVTLTETGFHCERTRQVFASSIGSIIDQTRTSTGAGMAAYCFKDDEIQKRSYPNSFGGQYQIRAVRARWDLR